MRPAPAGAAQPCGPAPGDVPAGVAAVSDTLELRLADGRVLRLAGLDPPRATAADPALPAKAKAGFESWLAESGGVMVRILAAEPDRWNRLPALVFRTAPAGSASQGAAEALLGAGWARARPEPATRGCLAGVLAAEAEARAAARGLWADPAYAVRDPDDAPGLAAATGGMALVEGRLAVHESRGTFYLTLGRDRWGFTAVLPRRAAERFRKAGLDIADYAGTVVRLRGDLDDRFGPRLTLDDPEQLESIEPGMERATGVPGRPARRRDPPPEGN